MNRFSLVKNFPSRGRGFTLIELMISISILLLLLFTGTYSYSMLASRWDKELGSFSESASEAKNVENIQRLLEGVIPQVVVDKDNKPNFFFIGGDRSLLGVSRSGLLSGNYPEIFRFSVIENTDHSFDLVYQSKSTEKFLLKKVNQTIDFSHQITLLKNLKSIEFSYYGYSHLFEKTSLENQFHPKWFQAYSGIDQLLTPEKVKLVLVKEESALSMVISLNNNPELLLSPYSKDYL